jgi:hypothetical protein
MERQRMELSVYEALDADLYPLSTSLSLTALSLHFSSRPPPISTLVSTHVVR